MAAEEIETTGRTYLSTGSWPEIVREHQRCIYNLAYNLCHNRDEADDLTQEVFLKAFENLEGFRGEARLRIWLHRITINTYLAKRRNELKHESINLRYVPVPDWNENPERVAIKRELQWCIHHTLRFHLSRSHQVILVLRDLKGFSYEEIASMLGISLSAVKSRLHRARLSYRNHLISSGCAGLVKDYSCYCEGVTKNEV